MNSKRIHSSYLIMSALIVAGAALCPGVTHAADPEQGKKTFLDQKCNNCHSIEAAQVAKKGGENIEGGATPPDLSGVGKSHDAKFIADYLKKKETIHGKKHLKKFSGSDEELGQLSNWLASLKTGKKLD